ncbi:DUF1028 domain-containing protein [Roseomonas alkaliterrae]|uniref:Putative Ntn-hydrolase superfamily protein n=1 Tax=Neoroseomonas alkaliterrae TaxID=1452450 RepID=A0A840XV68_9PROT|nr:DUF1028 domain-containing protein [Neoroseomonas alkaliterrae]MBB5690980.1 putative Ntn-hydrolase superfamily protein [Neoroseomonas alkaliterrae]MBR0674646.1 DUF1028 domain-containing protein [Neoroseomonas alkaliterrae]
MTFSLLGRCARTGQFGAAVTTSSIAVGTRVPFLEAGIGGVLTQHRTDPRLGPRGLGLLRSGCTAEETVAALVASTPHHRWRQIAVMDAAGRTAHFDGANVKPERGAAHGPGVVAIGNILSSPHVPAAMAAAFEATEEAPLAERLLRALEAGEAAGGEHGEVTSASLLVVHRECFPYVDLRVDKDPRPLAALRRLWEEYAPLADGFVRRALDPDDAPII